MVGSPTPVGDDGVEEDFGFNYNFSIDIIMKTETLIIIAALLIIIYLLFRNLSYTTPTAPVVIRSPTFLTPPPLGGGPGPMPLPISFRMRR